jgi:hypothetical protein
MKSFKSFAPDLQEKRIYKVTKGDKERMVNKQELNTYKQMGWKEVKEEVELDEKLKASDDMGDWVKDFQDSNAPQFKGKSQKKRQQMAVAAKLSAERNEEVELDESEINDLTAQYINENNITLEELDNMTEEELNELIGKAIGGAFKIGAKAAVGAARLAGKGVKKAVYNKQGNVRGTQAAKNDASKAQVEKLKQKRKEVVQKRLQQRKANQLKSSIDREKNKLAASKAKANK